MQSKQIIGITRWIIATIVDIIVACFLYIAASFTFKVVNDTRSIPALFYFPSLLVLVFPLRRKKKKSILSTVRPWLSHSRHWPAPLTLSPPDVRSCGRKRRRIPPIAHEKRFPFNFEIKKDFLLLVFDELRERRRRRTRKGEKELFSMKRDERNIRKTIKRWPRSPPLCFGFFLFSLFFFSMVDVRT